MPIWFDLLNTVRGAFNISGAMTLNPDVITTSSTGVISKDISSNITIGDLFIDEFSSFTFVYHPYSIGNYSVGGFTINRSVKFLKGNSYLRYSHSTLAVASSSY
jgi:hypothetical protein